MEAADRLGYTLLVTADHGNADQMQETDKKGNVSVRTAHSLNPVPFILYGRDNARPFREGAFGLANVAPTIAALLEITPPECWEASML
jgi:2,3-bisphosphoglycerate-independent phosphoglycerate mutase